MDATCDAEARPMFDDLTDPATIYWLGFLFADGYTRVYTKIKRAQRYSIRLHLAAQDLDHLEKFRAFCKRPNKIFYRKNNNSYVYHFDDKVCCFNLRNLGVVAQRCRNCTELPAISDDLFRHFVRGWFDGDGTVGVYQIKDKRVNRIYERIQLRLTFTTLAIPALLLDRLKRFGIHARIIAEKTKALYHLSITNKASQQRFIEWIYQDTPDDIILKRKYGRSLLALEALKSKKGRHSKSCDV